MSFAFFCHESRGLYYNIGIRKPGEDFAHPIHSELFHPDEECIRTGMLVQIAGSQHFLGRCHHTVEELRVVFQCWIAAGKADFAACTVGCSDSLAKFFEVGSQLIQEEA